VQALSENYRMKLTLNGITEISPEVGTSLSKIESYLLSLDGLQSMNLETAKALSKTTDIILLYLANLSSIDQESLKELAKFQGDIITNKVIEKRLEEAKYH
jgi:hypothetical protein